MGWGSARGLRGVALERLVTETDWDIYKSVKLGSDKDFSGEILGDLWFHGRVRNWIL